MAVETAVRDQVSTRVFLSYSRKDTGFLERLAAALNAHRYATLFDQTQRHDDPDAHLSAQDEWWTQLKTMIAGCDVMIFIVSPDSAASPVCDDEIAHARSLGKRVIAIYRRTIDFNAAPERLRALNVRLDFRDDSDSAFDSALHALSVELDTDIDWHRRGTRLMRQAQQWEADGRPDGQLLRAGAIADADAWAARRPRDAPEPGPLLLAFLDKSRAKETEDTAKLREITARAFVGPVQIAVAEGRHEEAVRLAAAAIVLSGDRHLAAVPELWDAVVPAAHDMRLIARFDASAVSFEPPQVEGSQLIPGGGFAHHLHDKSLWYAQITPDGAYAITSTLQGPACVWSVECAALLHCVATPTEGIFAVAISPDGERIATSGLDQPVSIWRIKDGALLARSSDALSTNALCFSPDGAKVWGVRGACFADTGDTAQSLEPIGALPWNLSVSPDGNHVAVAEKVKWGERSNIHLFAAQSGKRVAKIQARRDHVTQLLFRPDSKALLVLCEEDSLAEIRGTEFGSDKYAAQLFAVPSGELLIDLVGHDAPLNGAAFSPDGARIVTTSDDRTARVWDAVSGAELSRRNDIPFRASGLGRNSGQIAFHPDAAWIASASDGGNAILWDAAAVEPLLRFRHDRADEQVVQVSLTSDGTRCLTATEKGQINVWDTSLTHELARFEDHADAVASVAFSPDGRLLAALGEDRKLVVRDLDSSVTIATLEVPLGSSLACFFTPDAKALVAIAANGELHTIEPQKDRAVQVMRIWRVADWFLEKEIEGQGDFGQFLPWPSPRYAKPLQREEVARLLSAHGFDEERAIADVRTLEQFRVGEVGLYNFAGACDDSRRFFLRRQDVGPAIHSRSSGRLLCRPAITDAEVRDAAFSPDGNRIALARSDGTVIVIDTANLQFLDKTSDVVLAALVASGVGRLTEKDRESALLRTSPTDLYDALVASMPADEKQSVLVVAEGLRLRKTKPLYRPRPPSSDRRLAGTRWSPAIEKYRVQAVERSVNEHRQDLTRGARAFERTLHELTCAALRAATQSTTRSVEGMSRYRAESTQTEYMRGAIHDAVELAENLLYAEHRPTSLDFDVQLDEGDETAAHGAVRDTDSAAPRRELSHPEKGRLSLWELDSEPRRSVERGKQPDLDQEQLSFCFKEYITKPYRTPEFDRFLCRALIAAELYEFGKKLYLDAYSSPLKKKVPWYVWVMFIAVPLGVLVCAGFGLAWALEHSWIGPWGHWLGFGLGIVAGLVASMAFGVPKEMKRQGEEIRQWASLFLAMQQAYREVPQEGPFSVEKIAERVNSARALNVTWPAALYALLEDMRSVER